MTETKKQLIQRARAWFREKSWFRAPRNKGPKSGAERLYCGMIMHFLDALGDVEHDSPETLAREMDRTETALGRKRARELEEWTFAREKEIRELEELEERAANRFCDCGKKSHDHECAERLAEYLN